MLGIITNKSSSNSVVYLDSNLIKYIATFNSIFVSFFSYSSILFRVLRIKLKEYLLHA